MKKLFTLLLLAVGLTAFAQTPPCGSTIGTSPWVNAVLRSNMRFSLWDVNQTCGTSGHTFQDSLGGFAEWMISNYHLGTGSGTVTSITFNSPLTGGTISTTGTVGIPAANGSTNGYLSSSDWTLFNNKQFPITVNQFHFVGGNNVNQPTDLGNGLTFDGNTLTVAGADATSQQVVIKQHSGATGADIINVRDPSNANYFGITALGYIRSYALSAGGLAYFTAGKVLRDTSFSVLTPTGTPTFVAYYDATGHLTGDGNFARDPSNSYVTQIISTDGSNSATLVVDGTATGAPLFAKNLANGSSGALSLSKDNDSVDVILNCYDSNTGNQTFVQPQPTHIKFGSNLGNYYFPNNHGSAGQTLVLDVDNEHLKFADASTPSQPLDQVVTGTGTGLTSDANFTHSPSNNFTTQASTSTVTNVGTGAFTISPSQELVQWSSQHSDSLAELVANSSQLALLTQLSGVIITHDNNIYFKTNGTQRDVINPSGEMGIGTLSPSTNLQVVGAGTGTSWGNIEQEITSSGTEAGLLLNNTSDDGHAWSIISTGTGSGITAGVLSFGTGSFGALELHANQSIKFPGYGSGTFTGTPTFGLSVDASGNIIETSTSGTAWSLTGNSGTNPATNFVGTTDNKPFTLKSDTVVKINLGNKTYSYFNNNVGGSNAGIYAIGHLGAYPSLGLTPDSGVVAGVNDFDGDFGVGNIANGNCFVTASFGAMPGNIHSKFGDLGAGTGCAGGSGGNGNYCDLSDPDSAFTMKVNNAVVLARDISNTTHPLAIYFNSTTPEFDITAIVNESLSLQGRGTGKVGIGTLAPTTKLDVNGDITDEALAGGGTQSIGVDNTGKLIVVSSASGTVTSIATTAPITGGTITSTGTIGITQATNSTDGYLSSTDWNTFNNKASTTSLTGTSGAPSIAAGAGAGTSPTVSIVGTNIGGIVTVTTGTLGVTTGIVATITYNGLTYGTDSYPILYPDNAATALLSGTTMVFADGTTTTFVITSGAAALTPTTTYKWNYCVTGK